MSKRALLIVATTIAAFSFTVAAVALSQANYPASDSLATQAAKVTGRVGAQLTKPIVPMFDESDPVEGYQDTATAEEFWVEKSTMRIRRYSNPKAQLTKGPAVSEGLVVERAEAELKTAYNPSRIAQMKREVKHFNGVNHRGFAIRYTEYIGDVETFNYADMTFAPDGTLASMLMQDYPVTASLEPSLGQAVAIELVAEQLRFERRSSENAHLVVRRDPFTGEQNLCWAVDLRTGDSDFGASGFGLVDARDGTLLDLAISN